MKKIRVMHCLGQLNTGGAETLVMNILRKIDREKYQFNFLLFSKDKGFYDVEAKQLGSDFFYTSNLSSVGIIQYVKQMISIFKKEKPDVVHSHMDWLGGFIAYAAHKANVKKIVVHSHANQKMFERSFVRKVLINISKYLIKKYATDCIACSKEAGESLFKKEFEIILNGIDVDRYVIPDQSLIEELRKEFNIKEDEIILGNVGSLSENKNQQFLIELLYELRKENNKYRLILVGAGSCKCKLLELCIKLNVRDYVLFAGVRKEIPEIMHLFDLFLFPSKLEGLGIVAIEAQMCGLNCIVSDTIPKAVDITNDLMYFTPLEKEKWINKVKELKDKKVTVDTNEFLASKYSIIKVCEKLEKIYFI